MALVDHDAIPVDAHQQVAIPVKLPHVARFTKRSNHNVGLAQPEARRPRLGIIVYDFNVQVEVDVLGELEDPVVDQHARANDERRTRQVDAERIAVGLSALGQARAGPQLCLRCMRARGSAIPTHRGLSACAFPA